jgi:hypothetical protein
VARPGGGWAPRPDPGQRVFRRELLERAGPEVAHIVNLVAMEQRRDAVTAGPGRRDVQDQLAAPEAQGHVDSKL